MAIFNFNPISFVKGLFSRETESGGVPPSTSTPPQAVPPGGRFSVTLPSVPSGPLVPSSNVTGASRVAQSSAKEQPTVGGGLTGAAGRAAKKATEIAKSIPSDLNLANISSLFPGSSNKAIQDPKPESADFVNRGDIKPRYPENIRPPSDTTRQPTNGTEVGKTKQGDTIIKKNDGGIDIIRQDTRERLFNPGTNSFDILQAPTGNIGTFMPLGGFSQSSFDPFGTGVQGAPGGASLLPGSFGPGPFRTAGINSLLPTDEEERKKRQNIINKADFSLGGFFNDILGIPTARAETTPPTSNQQPPQQGGPLNLSFGPNGPVNIGGGAPVAPRLLSNQQQNLISSTRDGAPSYSQQFVGPGGLLEPGPVSGFEFSRATTGKTSQPSVKPGDTISSMRTNIQNRSSEALSTINNVNQSVKTEIQKEAALKALSDSVNKSGGYVKVADPTSGQINVAKINPDGSVSYIGPQEFEQAKLNIDHLPDVGQFNSDFQKNLNATLSQSIDTVTGRPYTKEDLDLSQDNPLKNQLDKLNNEITKLKEKYDFDIDINEERTKIIQEEGLATLRSQKKTLNENINGILGVYEKLADEIKNDPDFSQRLKSRRLQFLSDEQKRALTGFQRQLEILNEDIKVTEDRVSQRVKDRLDTYTIQFNQLKNLEAQEEKIRNAIAKADDDDRQLIFNTVNTFGGGTLDKSTRRAILDQLHNKSMISAIEGGLTLKQKSLELQAQSVANRTPTNIFITNPVTGEQIQGRYVPRGTPGLSDTQADEVNGDIAAARTAITDVQNSNLSQAQKEQSINAIIDRTSGKYINNKVALGYVTGRLGTPTVVGSQVGRVEKESGQEEFDRDLSSELSLVDSGFFGKNSRAKDAKQRLLGKYPERTSTINAAFKPYKN